MAILSGKMKGFIHSATKHGSKQYGLTKEVEGMVFLFKVPCA